MTDLKGCKQRHYAAITNIALWLA